MSTEFIVEEVTEAFEEPKEEQQQKVFVEPESFKEYTDKETEEIEKSKNFIRNFLAYIKSKSFFRKCGELARRKGVPRKQVANNFLGHVLGTISDVIHIAIDTVQDVAITIVQVLSSVLTAGASLICNVAKRLVRVVTLNKTCVA